MAIDDEGNDASSTGPRRKPLRPFTLVVVLVAAVAFGGVALAVAAGNSGAAGLPRGSCGPTAAKLTVQGTGQATGTPDLLTVVVEVSASGPSAAAALTTDNTLAGGVVTAFEGGGVAARDIQTSDLTLQPQYAYPKGVPTVIGYQVTNSITASLHDIAVSGGIIDAVVGSGGNAVQIESIAFSTGNPGLLDARARSAATTQAMAHARALARAAGRSLGPVCSLTDESAVSNDERATANYSLAAPSAAGVPIESGSQAQFAQVSLVYALGPPLGHSSRSGKTS
jgi:uncharacterized protein YggE